MAAEFNVVETDNFFLGEDKALDAVITDANGIPVDVTLVPMEWSLKKTVKALDPPLIDKKTVSAGGTGITVIGVYNVNPATNTQKVRVTFVPTDTVFGNAAGVKHGVAYHHSLKRTDTNTKNILYAGTFTFRLATEH